VVYCEVSADYTTRFREKSRQYSDDSRRQVRRHGMDT
jgi:hypothetical protein